MIVIEAAGRKEEEGVTGDGASGAYGDSGSWAGRANTFPAFVVEQALARVNATHRRSCHRINMLNIRVRHARR